jgi:mediator of DNA damage checkpoint protein 1
MTQALKLQKMIGTLAWLFHVESSGVLTPPIDQLLHYPIPLRGIGGFERHVSSFLFFPLPLRVCLRQVDTNLSAQKITVTNYTGESREYLKRLITTMGAEFTPNMSGGNTVVVAALYVLFPFPSLPSLPTLPHPLPLPRYPTRHTNQKSQN